MLRIEKSARVPENTAQKGPELEYLCNDRVYLGEIAVSLKIDKGKLLQGMYSDGYFPNNLVDKLRDIILGACSKIEEKSPKNLEELYSITCEATELINDLQEEFEENDSEIETVAGEEIALAFEVVAKTYGFENADLEDLVATRDW
ncbi:MAG: DUF5713 family protein [Exilibacterium sp.]